MRQRGFSIRWHLAIFGLITVCPLLVAGGFLAAQYADKERARLQEETRKLATDTSYVIDRELDGMKAALLALATSPSVLSGDFEGLHRQARQVIVSFPDSAIGLRRPDGQQLVVTGVPFGAPLATTNDAVLRDADREVIKTRQPVVSNLYTGVTLKRQLLVVEVPVIVGDDVAYILNLAFPPERILSIMRSRALASDWRMAVIDGNNRIVARSVDHDRFVGGSASPDLIARSQSRGGSFRSTTLDGVPVLTAFVRSSLSGWAVVASVPLVVLEAPLTRSLIIVGGLAALALLISIVLAVIYTRYVTEPVSVLARRAGDLGRGQEVDPLRTGILELDGVATALAGASRELKRRAGSQDQLINELNHRVKNTLATIQSIASQTAKRSPAWPEFRKAFEGRLMALSHSHNALTRTGWLGATIGELAEAAIRPFADVGPRVRMSAEVIELAPRAAITLGMILHELATNAVKYGALSRLEGRVDIRWRREATDACEVVHFDWIESRGPAVLPPTSKGFGSTLIVAGIQGDLGGDAQIDYEPGGLHLRATFPLTRLAPGTQAEAAE